MCLITETTMSSAAQRTPKGGPHGFTLVELLVVMAIIALLLSLCAPRYFQSLEASKETILKENLRVTRKAIDEFHTDTGRYPDDLAELVARKYLQALPFDPYLDSTDGWLLEEPEDLKNGRLHDLHSGAPGTTRNGTPFGLL